jgi:hypothetical protein
MLAKTAVQLAMVGSVVLLVLRGGDDPVMAFAWAGAAFLAMGCVVLADRQRFRESGYEPFEVLEVVHAIYAPLTLADPQPAYEYVHPADVPFHAHVT